MENLRITVIQSSLHWEDCDANLAMFDSKVNAVTEATDLIVLPEMFTTGFAVEREHVAEEQGGAGLQWMIKKSKERNCIITGSIAVKENGKMYNRLYWVGPDGNVEHYDKRHLFRMAKENIHFTGGSSKKVFVVKGWKIAPFVCYDLRFPVWTRNRWDKELNAEYDVMLFVANWPEVRNFPWKSLLVARAIENQSFVIGVNRVGQDGNGIAHSGDSAVLNPRGEKLSTLLANEEKSETVLLDYAYLENFRKQFPVGMDADEFELR